MTKKYLAIEKAAFFPNLNKDNYYVTSLETPTYNCIAHAAGKNDNWWWPDEASPGAYWPSDIDKEETVDAFILAYGSEGYEVCPAQDRNFDPKFEKVAIYVDVNDTPTHAARQLLDGYWTSKLGEAEDICHYTLEAIEDKEGRGLGYGRVKLILRRKI